MKKHLVATLVAGTLFSTVALAHCGCGGKNTQINSTKQCGQMYKQGSKDKKFHKKQKHNKMPLMRVMNKLDLSKDQKEKLQELMREKRQDRVRFSSFFTDTSFDSARYEAHLKQKRDNSFKNRSKMIESFYNVLNTEQKQKLKSLLEAQEERKKRRS